MILINFNRGKVHKNQAEAIWNLGNNPSICFKTESKICFQLKINLNFI